MKVFSPAHRQGRGWRVEGGKGLNSVTSQLAAQGGSSPPSRCSTIDRSQAGGAVAAAAAATAATAQKLEKQQFTPKIRPPHGDCKQDIDLSAPGGNRGGGGQGVSILAGTM